MKQLGFFLGFCVLLLFLPAACLADNATGQPVSLSQAVQMAQQNNINLIMAQNTNQQAQKTYNYTSDNFSGFTPVTTGPSNPYVPNAGDVQSQINLMQSNYGWQESSKNLSYLKDATTFQTMYDYFAVQDALEAESVAEKSQQQAQVAYNNTLALHAQGMATDAQLEAAKAALDGANSGLANAKNDIDNAYTALNTLLGLDPHARPVLNTQVAYQKDDFFKAINQDAAVNRALANSPAVFQAQSNVSITNQTRYYNQVPDVGPLQYLQAQNAYNQAVQQVTQQTISAFLAIDNAEKGYAAAQKALTAAEMAYKNAQVNYRVGMATKQDLLTAQLNQEQAGIKCAQALHGIFDARGQLALLMGVGAILPANLS
ncbi:TolC family protein [Desulfotomaculum copahuensis]|nr:TolC family protein [Desulfotomaculum copahuensis]